MYMRNLLRERAEACRASWPWILIVYNTSEKHPAWKWWDLRAEFRDHEKHMKSACISYYDLYNTSSHLDITELDWIRACYLNCMLIQLHWSSSDCDWRNHASAGTRSWAEHILKDSFFCTQWFFPSISKSYFPAAAFSTPFYFLLWCDLRFVRNETRVNGVWGIWF